jgi:hypothetical protein
MKQTLLLLLLSSSQVFAQTTSTTTTTKSPKPTRGTAEIHGRCTIDVGGSSLVAGPCSETILVLLNTKGDEVVKARTDHDGNFEFTGLAEGDYKIGSGSRFFDVAKPTGTVHTGQTIELFLQQK